MWNNASKIPELEPYIISVWPFKESNVPTDHDGLDRKNDITFSDKTEYDEKVAVLVTDYVELVKNVKNIADKHIDNKMKGKFKSELDRFLTATDAESRRRTGQKRKYQELIKGRFRLREAVRIEREDDGNGISGKFADFTKITIDKLIADGERDAREALGY